MILTYLPLILYDRQAEMVNKALQTQRTFLKMASTHQEPAEVRNTETDSWYSHLWYTLLRWWLK